MCGVAGLLDPTGSTPAPHLAAAVDRMTAALGHRGPDDSGAWVDAAAGVAVGHRRLAVVDISVEGHQPMASADGRYLLTYNGEVYNHRELRRDLQRRGHAFRGHSDTEVLLAAIVEHGLEAALRRTNGMFALALWDRHQRRLHLSRDRLGEKPLYYGWAHRTFLFGSELKSLRAHPAFTGRVDRGALALYARHSYVPSPWSIYEGVRKLPPATILTVDPAAPHPQTEPRPYWSAFEVAAHGAAEPLQLPDDQVVEELEALLRDAVGLRMAADVPLGAFLSGGVDSSTVTALMQAQSPRPVRTFTIGFPGTGYDEAADAAAVAAHLGTDHQQLSVSPAEAQAVIPRLPTLYDEPFADSSQIPTFLVSQMARQDVTVALSGDGGDEVFGGYNRYVWIPEIWRRVGWAPPRARAAAARALLAVPAGGWDALTSPLPSRMRPRIPASKVAKLAAALTTADPGGTYLRMRSQWDDPARLVVGTEEPVSLLTDRAAWPALPGIEAEMMSLDIATYLPDDILVKLDRASMAVGLESRVPLLDHRLVKFASRLPLSQKVRGGKGKWALRQVLDRHVPRRLIDRPKMGFGVPIGEWLRGPLRSWAADLLDPALLRRDGYLDPELVRGAWADHRCGRRDREHELWSVLMFQAWLQEQ